MELDLIACENQPVDKNQNAGIHNNVPNCLLLGYSAGFTIRIRSFYLSRLKD